MNHNLKKSLDKAIGRKKRFTEADVKAIYAKIKMQDHHKKKIPKLKITFAYTMTALLLLGFSWMEIHENYDRDSSNQLNASQKLNQLKNDSLHQKVLNGESDLANKYPNKFNIVKKMYYARNNLQNAQGEFEFGAAYTDRMHVQFYADYSKKMKLSHQETIKNGKVIGGENLILKKGVITLQSLNKNIFVKKPLKNEAQRTGSSVNYEESEVFSNEVTDSEWYIEIYNNYANWSYKTSNKLGMATYEIKGVDKLKRQFTMTLAKDTGILLNFKLYNRHHDLIYFIHVMDVRINKGVPSAIFHLNLSDDHEVPWEEFIKNSVGYITKK